MRKMNLSLAAFVMVTFLIVGSFTNSGSAYAQSAEPVTVQSKESFDQTLKDLKQQISQNGMMVLSEIDQGKILSMTGLSLKAHSLFVGNPTIGNKLFTANRGVGIAVPVRLNIYEGKDGKTYVSYVKPSGQLASFKEEEIQKTGGMLDQKFQQLTGMIAK